MHLHADCEVRPEFLTNEHVHYLFSYCITSWLCVDEKWDPRGIIFLALHSLAHSLFE